MVPLSFACLRPRCFSHSSYKLVFVYDRSSILDNSNRKFITLFGALIDFTCSLRSNGQWTVKRHRKIIVNHSVDCDCVRVPFRIVLYWEHSVGALSGQVLDNPEFSDETNSNKKELRSFNLRMRYRLAKWLQTTRLECSRGHYALFRNIAEGCASSSRVPYVRMKQQYSQVQNSIAYAPPIR